jgi:hypothetical protein
LEDDFHITGGEAERVMNEIEGVLKQVANYWKTHEIAEGCKSLYD